MKWVGYSKIDSKENSVHSVLGIILDSNYSEIKNRHAHTILELPQHHAN